MEGLIVSKSLVCEPPSQYPRVIAGSQPVFRQRNRHSGQWRQPQFWPSITTRCLSLFKRAERVRKEPCSTRHTRPNRKSWCTTASPSSTSPASTCFSTSGIRQRERDPPHFSPQLRLRFDQPSPEKNVDKRNLYENLDVAMLVSDEIATAESSWNAIIQSINPTRGRPKSKDIPLGEQTVAQVTSHVIRISVPKLFGVPRSAWRSFELKGTGTQFMFISFLSFNRLLQRLF